MELGLSLLGLYLLLKVGELFLRLRLNITLFAVDPVLWVVAVDLFFVTLATVDFGYLVEDYVAFVEALGKKHIFA